LVRHGESEYIVQDRFQGRADTPLSPVGLRQAGLVGARLARPQDAPALPVPDRVPKEIVYSPLQRAAQTAVAIQLAIPTAAGALATAGARETAATADATVALRADSGFLEIGQGEWEGLKRSEVDARYPTELAGWRRRPLESWAPGGESLPEVQARVAPTLAATLARLAHGHIAGSLDRPQVAGYRDAPLDQPWSIVVGHDGVFKVALLTLFDLPLERFWMWSMDLGAISIIELRAGRPVLRAHNLTGHLAGLVDEAAQVEQAQRSRSGAL
jgi:broad specificity phosphatase PhoE